LSAFLQFPKKTPCSAKIPETMELPDRGIPNINIGSENTIQNYLIHCIFLRFF